MPSLPQAAVALVEQYCDRRAPEDMRDEYRVECATQGNSITITERRPPWNPDFGPEWSATPVARLRYDERQATWTLYRPTTNSGWSTYDFIEPTREVVPLLAEIDADPTGIFWG